MKAFLCIVVPVGLLLVAGCTFETPLQPVTSSRGVAAGAASTSGRSSPGRPGYEEAFVNGKTVMINAIEVPPVAPEKAQADFYEVVYPNGWENLGIGTPQCNPCDHTGDGIDPGDYHDHILDSMPSDPGHGEYRAPWHVFVVVPAYNGNADHDAQLTAAYAAHVPTKSEAAVDELLAARLGDGSPVAIEIDTHFYFLCAVVSPNAAR